MTSSNNNPDTGWQGHAFSEDMNSDYNALTFVIKQILGRANIAAVCKVVKVTGGGVGKACFVTLQPLVNQVDGYGNAIPPGLLHNVPCYRMQSGNNAIICDPQVNDIGPALFSDRDISTLKANYNNDTMAAVLASGVNPNTHRRFSVADGMYFGGVYNGTPVNYIQFLNNKIVINTIDEVDITATNKVTVTSPWINLSSWVGMIAAFGRTTAPQGWLACPAAQTLVSTTTYADLFNAIGYAWGGAGGSFGLPFFPAGYTLLANGTVGTQSVGRVINHVHPYVTKASTAVQSGSSTPCWTGEQTINTSDPTTGGPANLPAGSNVLLCVKY